MRSLQIVGLAAALCLFSGSAHAGTVITTNLSGNAIAIANINARADGAQLYNQDVWHSPFSTTGSLPSITLPAGSYRFRIVNPADAASLFPALTGAQQAEIYTGWTYNTPWIENYLVFNAADTTTGQFFDGAGAAVGYGSAAAAYGGAFTDAANQPGDTDGSFNNIRYATRAGVTLDNPLVVLPVTTTLLFAVPDNGVFDNGGGVSVLVSGVPEPAAALALAPIAIVAMRRARR